MPFPSSSLVTLRPDLAQSFEQFDLEMDAEGFVAQRIAPVIDVDTATGNIGVIPVDQLLQSPDLERAPTSGYNRGRFSFTPDTYVTKEYGWEEAVDDNEARIYRRYFDAEVIAARRAMGFLLRALEVRVTSLFTDTTVFTGAKTGAAAAHWALNSSATPRADLETAIQAVYANSGMWPNTIIMNMKQFRNVRKTDDILNVIKYNDDTDPKAGKITSNVLAEVFGIQQVIIAGATKNTAGEGLTATPSQIWPDDKVFVGHIDMTGGQDFRKPTVARIFHYGEDGSTITGTVESYREDKMRSDVLRVRHQTGEKMLYSALGYLVTGVA